MRERLMQDQASETDRTRNSNGGAREREVLGQPMMMR